MDRNRPPAFASSPQWPQLRRAVARAAAATASAMMACAAPGAPARAQQLLSPQSQIRIAYEAPSNAQLSPIYERLKQRQVLEELQAFLAPLRLPRQITVRTAQCGATAAPYKSPGPVTVCYEMFDAIEKLAAANTQDQDFRQTVIAGAFIETVLHETASAMFDVLSVPIWGRERDAADRLAALIMVQFGEDVAVTTITGTANLFMWSDKKWTGSDFSDVASPEYQRFFNYVCVAYAAVPLRFGWLVEKGLLPKRRAGQCEGEYQQIRRAFNLRIMPYVDADALIKVRSTPWLTWAPAK